MITAKYEDGKNILYGLFQKFHSLLPKQNLFEWVFSLLKFVLVTMNPS